MASCQCSGSRRRSRSRGHPRSRRCRSCRRQMALPASYLDDPARRWADSPSPMQPRRVVTFEDSRLDCNTEIPPKTRDWSQPAKVDDSLPPSGYSNESPETVDWSQPTEGYLRCPLVLDPKVEEFLSGDKLMDDPSTWYCLPKPPFTDAYNWVAWQAEQVAMPTWWSKLMSILGQRDIHWLAQLVRASFQMPQACYAATKGVNNYVVPPTPSCLDQDTYLPMKDPRFGLQDYQLNQPQKTLAYDKALQH